MKFACLVAMVKFTAWARRASRRLFGRALNKVEISRGIVHVLLNCFLHGGCDDSSSAFSTSIHLTFYWMDQTSIQQVSSTPATGVQASRLCRSLVETLLATLAVSSGPKAVPADTRTGLPTCSASCLVPLQGCSGLFLPRLRLKLRLLRMDAVTGTGEIKSFVRVFK
jgi:hypothetical protein